MRASSLLVASFLAAMLAAPAFADPAPPMQGQTPPCPGARPGEQVLSCTYIPFARHAEHKGAYDAGPEYNDPDEGYRAGWADERRERFYRDEAQTRFNSIDLDAFVRSHFSEFRDSGWREEDADGWDGGWARDRGPAQCPCDDR